jgi:hypothetical protein
MEPLLMTDDFVRTAPIVSGPSNITTIMIAKAAGRKI